METQNEDTYNLNEMNTVKAVYADQPSKHPPIIKPTVTNSPSLTVMNSPSLTDSPPQTNILDELVTDSDPMSSVEEEVTVVEQKFAPDPSLKLMKLDELPSDPHMYWQLSEEERVLLTCLAGAYETTVLASLRERKGTAVLDSTNYSISDFLADCEVQVRHCIKFVHGLEDFQRLDLDDQIACFKGSISPVMNVRSSFTFVVERNTWVMNKGEMPINLSKKFFSCNPYLEWNIGLARQLKCIARNNTTIYALLHCIVLFDPYYSKLYNRQMVSTIRNKYILLLRHYLESTFSFAYSEDYFTVLQSKVIELRELDAANKKLSGADGGCEKYSEELVPFELLQELTK